MRAHCVSARSIDRARILSPTISTAGGGFDGPAGAVHGRGAAATRDSANCTTTPSASLGCKNASAHEGSDSSRPTIRYPCSIAPAHTASKLGTLNVT